MPSDDPRNDSAPKTASASGPAVARDSDSGMLSPAWADIDVDDILGDRAWVAAALRVEAALAHAQAGFGIVPADAAAAIGKVAATLEVDPLALAHGVAQTSNPVITLVLELQRAVDAASPGLSDHVHLGATSQDVMDTATMLVATNALTRLEASLGRVRAGILGLIQRHGAAPLAGRTLGQHAVPITFGVKASTWLNLVIDAETEVRALLDARLPVSLAGASGTLSAYREYAQQRTGSAFDPFLLVEAVAGELGLSPHYQPWHTARTPVAKLAGTLCLVGGALGKIATDIHLMSRTEVGEAGERPSEGGGISSSMPQKRNPVDATLILAASRQLPATALILFQGMAAAEDERSAGSWQSEWQPLRECLRMALGAASRMGSLVGGLRVDTARMRENLALTGPAVISERLTAALTPLVGKLQARDLLRRLLLSDAPSPAAPAAPGAPAGPSSPADLITRLRSELAAVGVDAAGLDLEHLTAVEDYVGASARIAERALERDRVFSASGRTA